MSARLVISARGEMCAAQRSHLVAAQRMRARLAVLCPAHMQRRIAA
jgi:hypothetical protein